MRNFAKIEQVVNVLKLLAFILLCTWQAARYGTYLFTFYSVIDKKDNCSNGKELFENILIEHKNVFKKHCFYKQINVSFSKKFFHQLTSSGPIMGSLE